MTSLSDKLTQLKLDFMARELDRVLTDAAARSLSPADSLEHKELPLSCLQDADQGRSGRSSLG